MYSSPRRWESSRPSPWPAWRCFSPARPRRRRRRSRARCCCARARRANRSARRCFPRPWRFTSRAWWREPGWCRPSATRAPAGTKGSMCSPCPRRRRSTTCVCGSASAASRARSKSGRRHSARTPRRARKASARRCWTRSGPTSSPPGSRISGRGKRSWSSSSTRKRCAIGTAASRCASRWWSARATSRTASSMQRASRPWCCAPKRAARR